MKRDTAKPASFVSPLVELPPSDRVRAAPLFARLDWHLAVPAVLAGVAAGTVYADRGPSPRSGLLLSGHRAYVAGDPANAGFLAALRPVLERRFAAKGQSGTFLLYYDRPEWAAAAEASLSPRLIGYRERRRCYFSRDERASAGHEVGALPPDFRLAVVDAELLDDLSMANREELTEEIRSERESVADFLARSFGMALLHDRSVAGWCLSEYNLGRRCEVGIAVAGPFRRRGLATVLGEAFARQALAAGVSEIGWHCWEDNAASCATARALGFSLARTYDAHEVRLAPS